MAEVISISRSGAMLDIVLGDPEGGNLISNEEGRRLAAAIETLEDEVRLVRLRSSGRDFCRGRVSPMPPPGSAVSALEIRTRVTDPALRVYDALRSSPAPVLGVVAGQALGFGCGLAAACDLVLASDAATFQVPEMERSIPPTLVMNAMARRLPYKAIAQLVLGLDVIGAQQALAWGLVSRVVPDASLSTEMEALTQRLAAYDLPAVRAIKTFLNAALPSGRGAIALSANLAAVALSDRFTGAAKS